MLTPFVKHLIKDQLKDVFKDVFNESKESSVLSLSEVLEDANPDLNATPTALLANAPLSTKTESMAVSEALLPPSLPTPTIEQASIPQMGL